MKSGNRKCVYYSIHSEKIFVKKEFEMSDWKAMLSGLKSFTINKGVSFYKTIWGD